MTIPFIYPPAPHVRRHGPAGYADHASYRPWLRDEFSFRCVYCLLRERPGARVTEEAKAALERMNLKSSSKQ